MAMTSGGFTPSWQGGTDQIFDSLGETNMGDKGQIMEKDMSAERKTEMGKNLLYFYLAFLIFWSTTLLYFVL